MISQHILNFLKDKKNLLAFSHGVDSTALFYLLLKKNISFDIAIVDYNLRNQSKQEVSSAMDLAKKYNKQIFINSIKLDSSNFEATARAVRYSFFEQIISQNDYDTLITAHQLNDKLEWFLMQFTKGAGLKELFGMKDIEEKEGYFLVRPLLNVSRDELLNFLQTDKVEFFLDETNEDTKYKRNYFRKEFSNKLLSEFSNGIKNSFKYLESDLNSFLKVDVKKVENLYILNRVFDENIEIKEIDKVIKSLGVIISKAQRDEIINKKSVVVSGKVAVEFSEEKIFISPYVTSIMTKEFKEKCRVLKIPPKVRGYLFQNNLIDLMAPKTTLCEILKPRF